MNAALLDRARFAKLLGMLGSHHDGEVAAAGRAAEAMVKGAGLTWHDVVTPTLPPPPRSPSRGYTVTEAVTFLLDRWDVLTDWEITFVEAIQHQGNPLSTKQKTVLDRLVERAQRAESRAA